MVSISNVIESALIFTASLQTFKTTSYKQKGLIIGLFVYSHIVIILLSAVDL